MAQHGQSGRIVVDVSPELKRRIYATLGLSGRTLKEWFVQSAEQFCEQEASGDLNRIDPRSQATVLEESERGYVCEPSQKHQRSEPKDKKHTLVSMFSGCGGMDLGFKGGFEIFGRRYKSLPFEIVWANDSNIEACKTYERNLRHPIHRGDVWDLLNTIPSRADVIVGGFPCQDISVNGKRKGVNGARSGLYKAMIEAIRMTKPRVFVAENVKALLRHEEWLQQVVDDFRDLGYAVHFHHYRAADYGVPQTRERVIFVGTAPGVPPFLPPIPERNASTWMSASEAISDLEGLNAAPQINHIWSAANISPEQGNRRLLPNRPGYTIRAECHGNIQFHYRLPRRISMREAARIQSFPDKFIFVSGLRQIERQVGNAVPPILAWHIATSVLECLR